MSNSNFFNASNLEKRIYNYNEYTKNIEHWNPYIEKLEISFFENKKNYFILGPENELGLKYLWKFDLGFNNNKLVLSSTETTKESNPCIKISIKNKIGYIDYINSCGDYRGKDITEWMIQIIKNLDCKKCILHRPERKMRQNKYI